MPTTRSATKKQTKLEDFADDDKKPAQTTSQNNKQKSLTSKVNTSTASTKATAKRKSSQEDSKPKPESKSTSKRQKQQHISSANTSDLENPIIINRAPVLQLWGATVAQFIHPSLSWSACLSIGNAISTLCAISKGKAIGMIEPKDKDNDPSEDRKPSKSKAKKDTTVYSVMGFPLHVKDDAVLMSGKPKKADETTLVGKFGQEQYDAVKKAMEDALRSWKGEEDELQKKAFHMYERFRPNVATGQKGWGRKGELNLYEIASVVGKS